MSGDFFTNPASRTAPRGPQVTPFVRVVPVPSGLARGAWKSEGATLAELRASAHPPAVEILSPAAGAPWEGTQLLRWLGSDSDGDTLTYFVLYSPDDRQSWEPLKLNVSASELEIDTERLPGGDIAWVRVVASDGLRFAAADVGPLQVPRKSPQVLTSKSSRPVWATATLIIRSRSTS
jgi:hypothetical protein